MDSTSQCVSHLEEDGHAFLRRMWGPPADLLGLRIESAPLTKVSDPVEFPPIRSLSAVEEEVAKSRQTAATTAAQDEAQSAAAAGQDTDAEGYFPADMPEQPSLQAWQSEAHGQQQQQQFAGLGEIGPVAAVSAPAAVQGAFGQLSLAAAPAALTVPFGSFELLGAVAAAPAAANVLGGPSGQAASAPAGPSSANTPFEPFGQAAAASSSAPSDPFGQAAAATATAPSVPFDRFGQAAAGPPAAGVDLDPFGQAAAAAASPAGPAPSNAVLDPFGQAAAAPSAAHVLSDPFGQAAAATAGPASSSAAHDSFGQAAAAPSAGPSSSSAPFDPFGQAAAVPAGTTASSTLADPFGQAATRAATAAQPALDPFSSAAAATPAAPTAAAPFDPFAQVAAAFSPPPAPAMAPALESDFASDNFAFGAALQTDADAVNNAAGADPLPHHINTCVLGDDGDCTIEHGMPLASGSFGTVYPGYYYDDPVAVKLLRVGLGEDEAAVRSRILKEVQLQARAINHSGVVKFVAVCFDPPAIVMEMCDCSLSARILNHWAAQQQQQQQQQQPHPSHHQQPQPSDHQQQPQQQEPELSWQLVVQLLRQAATALAFLHRRGNTILHNDVRAANMVLTRTYDHNGPSWKLKICDFGLAEAAGAGVAQVPELTHSSWRAPELEGTFRAAPDPAAQPPGLYTVTPAADVFALGCVLHEMLVPGLPQQQFPPSEQRLPGLSGPPPPALQALFQSCVAQSAQQRPSAQAVMNSLKNMQAV